MLQVLCTYHSIFVKAGILVAEIFRGPFLSYLSLHPRYHTSHGQALSATDIGFVGWTVFPTLEKLHFLLEFIQLFKIISKNLMSVRHTCLHLLSHCFTFICFSKKLPSLEVHMKETHGSLGDFHSSSI